MQRYDSYKDSGIQWLGEIPSHWEVVKLKSLCQMFGRIGFRGYSKEDLVDEGDGAITLSPSNFREGKIDFSKCSWLSWQKYYESPEIMVTNGDIVFVKTASIGKTAIVKDIPCETTINPQILVLKRITCCAEYLNYYLQNTKIQGWINASANGSTISTISQGTIGNYPIFLPSLSEQQAIVSYLDTATAKIDEAIAQQQKMIDLLNERKQIIINNAVTKGLNPNAKMKDSGVEYIGMIPEGWSVRRMASLGYFSKGGGISRDNLQEEGEPAILYGDIYTKYNYFAKDIENHIPQKVALESIEVHKNELLMTGSGETKEDIGKTVVFLGDKAYAGGDVIIFKQNENNSTFLSYVLNSSYAKDFRYKESKGEIVVHIYANAVRRLFVALPDITEQGDIVEYLNDKVGIIDSEISVIRKQIALLQERKQIIINDVVTGKVRLK